MKAAKMMKAVKSRMINPPMKSLRILRISKATGSRTSSSPFPPHRIEFLVRPDREGVGEPIGHCEQGGDRGDVPGVVVREAVALELRIVLFVNRMRTLRHLDREIEHRLLPRLKVGLAMID